MALAFSALFRRPPVDATRATVSPVGVYGPTGFTVVDSSGLTGAAPAKTLDAATASRSGVLVKCIDLTAGPASSLTPRVLRDTEPVDHPLNDVLGVTPNASMSSKTFWGWVFTRLLMPQGSCAVFVDRPNGSDVRALVPFKDKVEPLISAPTRNAPLGEVTGFRARIGNQWYEYAPGEVLWFRRPDWADFWGVRDPLAAAADPVALNAKAREWQHAVLEQGGAVDTAVYVGDVDEATHAKYTASLNSKTRGARNTGRKVVFAGETAPVAIPLGMTAKDLSFVESIEVNAKDIPHALGLPVDLVFGEAKYENAKVSDTLRWRDAILPLLEVVTSELDRVLFGGTDGLHVEFDLSEVGALKEDREPLVQEASAMAGMAGVWLIDEVREKLGAEPLPQGRGQVLVGGTPAGDPEPPAQDTTQDAQNSPEQVPDAAPAPESTDAVGDPEAAVEDRAVARAKKADPMSKDNVLAAYNSLEAAGIRAVKALADMQQEDVLNRLERERKKDNGQDFVRRLLVDSAPGEDVERIALNTLFDPHKWQTRTTGKWSAWFARVFDRGGNAQATSLGTSFDDYIDEVTTQMEHHLDMAAREVNATTLEAIRHAISGAQDGASIDDIAARITDQFDQMRGFRAKTIARTETVSGFNAAAHIGAVKSGLPDGEKVWVSTHDDRTRKPHTHIDGERRPMGERFSNGLDHPGDRSGKPEEFINCRCVVAYEFPDPA